MTNFGHQIPIELYVECIYSDQIDYHKFWKLFKLQFKYNIAYSDLPITVKTTDKVHNAQHTVTAAAAAAASTLSLTVMRQDEMLRRRFLFSFDLPPQPFVADGNAIPCN